MKKTNLKKIIAGILVMAMCLALAACGATDPATTIAEAEPNGKTAESGKPYRIGLSMGTSNTEFCMKVMAELEAACAENPDVELITQSADSDANMQVTNIDNLVTMGVDALCVYPVDPEICADAMKRARDAGISVIIVDQIPSDTDSFDIGISVSMHDLGVGVNEMTSDWIDATFPDAENGTVKCGVLGLWVTEQFAERCDVFNEMADYNPKAVVCESYDCGVANFATETAQNVEILLQKHPDVRAILCFTDSQAVIAEETIQKNKDALGLDLSKIGIFTVDHSTTSYDLLGKSASGESCLRGIVTTNLDLGKLMYRCAIGEFDTSELENGKILYQPIEKISAENMDDYAKYILG